MKYKAKRKLVEARRSIASGDWQKGDKQITAARKIEDSPNLTFDQLRALAQLRRFRKRILTSIGKFLSSNTEPSR